MLNLLSNLLLKAQFGSGFEPPVAGNDFLEGSNENAALLENVEQILSAVIGFITVIAGLFFLFNFIIAAFNMITTGGDQGKLEKARDRMIHGVLGLIIVVATYAIVGLIGAIVGLDILNPAAQLLELAPGAATP